MATGRGSFPGRAPLSDSRWCSGRRTGRSGRRCCCGKWSTTVRDGPWAGSWGEVLGDTTVAAAMLDRLLHRSVVLTLDGDSYRLRDHHARTDTLRRATTGTRTPLR